MEPKQEHLDFIIAESEQYYEDNTKPIYLSALGSKFLHEFQVKVRDVYDVSLAELIQTKLDAKIVVIRHDTHRQIVVCCPKEKADLAREFVDAAGKLAVAAATQKESISEIITLDLPRVQNALVLAFQQIPKNSEKIFIKLERPIHFQAANSNPDLEIYYELSSEDAMPNRPFQRLDEMTSEQLDILKEKIINWIKKHSIPVGRVYFDGNLGYRSVDSGKNKDNGRQVNALSRLLDSQPQKIRKEIVIPLDLAELLSRYE